MSSLIPTTIVDRNGLITTRNKRPEHLTNGRDQLPSTPPITAISNIYFDLDQYLVEAYTSGDCWMLAHQIHDITGWDVVALGEPDDTQNNPAKLDWYHMANLLPDGRVLDINGIHNQHDVMREWIGESETAVITTLNDKSHLDDREPLFDDMDVLGDAIQVIELTKLVPAHQLDDMVNKLFG